FEPALDHHGELIHSGPATTPGQDPDRLLSGQQPARLVRAHIVYVPGLYVSATRSAQPVGAELQRIPASAQRCGPDEDERDGAIAEAAPQDDLDPRRPRTLDQPDRARLDAVLRSVLPFQAVPAAGARQLLPDAVPPSQAQTVAEQEKGGLRT